MPSLWHLLMLTAVVSSVKIASRRITNWGDWGAMELCPTGTYAKGIQVKTSGFQREWDDTALNAVALYCAAPGGGHDMDKRLVSNEGRLGGWGGIKWCNGFIIGFTLIVQRDFRGDDTATGNIRVRCSSGEVVEGDGHNWGVWQAESLCPKGYVVNGIRTQVEPYQGPGWMTNDDTALNNVDMECARITDDCRPADAWVRILTCENRNTHGLRCDYQRTIGMQIGSSSSSNGSESSWSESSLGARLSARFKFLIQAKLRAVHTWGSSTSYNWAQAASRTFNEETTMTLKSGVVPQGRSLVISQVQGSCGAATVMSSHFRSELIRIEG